MPAPKPSAIKSEHVPLLNLLLDKDNPRLASTSGQSSTKEELVRVLWREMAVDEVALSIAANGYYEDEPLLVVPERGASGKETGNFIVVEGNRRLAAVLLLRDAALRKFVRVSELPKLSAAAISRLNKLPVNIHPTRESLWPYLGFRHINGTKPWDAFSKAKYIANVYETIGIPLNEIARRIGDRHATVRRMYNGFVVLRQAEKAAGFAVEDRVKNRFHFSHLYTALDYPEVQTFLGVTPERLAKRDPVAKSHLGDLSDLMTWLYGRRSDQREPVIKSQYPDLGNLRRVLGKPQAVALLRRGYPLEQAYDVSRGDKTKFREALSAAKQEMQSAKAAVTTGYNGEDDLFETMEEINATGGSILREMTDKRGSRRKAS